MRLLLDQGLPRSAAGLLNDAGWDVRHVGACGLGQASDAEILAFGLADRRAICTLDADFHALLALGEAVAPSVVRIRREGLRGADVAALLLAIHDRINAALQRGAAIVVTDRAIRIRYLPLRSAGVVR